MKENILLGKWTPDGLERLISSAALIKSAGERIDFLSKHFLGTDYKESTLTGDINRPEVFVVNLGGVDCFTFIDYIEAMRLSSSFPAFTGNLKMVRYRMGEVAFDTRNHFFTDWREFNTDFVSDVTERIGAHKTRKIVKMLNEKKDGTYYIQGISPVSREITYIPTDAIDDSVLDQMRTGDYVGVYSTMPGLDVSHVGIYINDRDSIYWRNASSDKRNRMVVDQDFRDYISGRPGLVVLRPKDFPVHLLTE